MDLRSHSRLSGQPQEPEVRDKETFLGMVLYGSCRILLLRQRYSAICLNLRVEFQILLTCIPAWLMPPWPLL